jgi:lipoprotein-anchoring transpeptidase ErfK/SrfK
MIWRMCAVGLAAASVIAASGSPSPAASSPDSAGVGLHRLLVLRRDVVVHQDPWPGGPAIARIAMRTPLTRATTVLPIVREARGPAGGRWLRVGVPARPNGTTGWVPAEAGTITETPWTIVIQRARRRALVLRAGRVVARFPVVLGKRSTPTPLGRFFVTEKLPIASGVAEGPWALATSAYSDVLRQFGGGPGQIALHGTVGFDDPLGTYSSHGCIRFSAAAITWIAHRVVDGTPVIVES